MWLRYGFMFERRNFADELHEKSEMAWLQSLGPEQLKECNCHLLRWEESVWPFGLKNDTQLVEKQSRVRSPLSVLGSGFGSWLLLAMKILALGPEVPKSLLASLSVFANSVNLTKKPERRGSSEPRRDCPLPSRPLLAVVVNGRGLPVPADSQLPCLNHRLGHSASLSPCFVLFK